MYRLYQKSELNFSLLWIGLYVLLYSLADAASEALGLAKVITAPTGLAMSAFLLCWLRRHDLTAKYGLIRFQGQPRRYLYFLPLIVLLTVNLWNGASLTLSPVETALYILSMLTVGFLEEVIFRGLLLKALCTDARHERQAILIASLTFGFGHLVNLLNGASLGPTLLQLLYASAVGFLFTVMFLRSGSLMPCIIAHGLFNSLSAFSRKPSMLFQTMTALLMTLISAGYALWLWHLPRKPT